MRLLGIPTVSELHRRLDNNPAPRRVCGMDRPGALPSADTIRRVRRQLEELAESLRELIGDTITELKKYLPDLGCEVAVDPKTNVWLFGGRLRRMDPEWRRLYHKRWSAERVISLWKGTGRLNAHRLRAAWPSRCTLASRHSRTWRPR